MRAGRSTPFAGVLGFCLLAMYHPGLGGPDEGAGCGAWGVGYGERGCAGSCTPHASFHTPVPPPPRTPSEAARQVARRHFTRAQQAVNQEREDLEAWDPDAVPPSESETWRLQLMARDRSGELRRALEAARQAAALARTPREAYEAALLRARLEDDAGHLDIELSQVQKLIALQPHNLLSVFSLHRSARSRWREAAARRATLGPIERPPTIQGG